MVLPLLLGALAPQLLTGMSPLLAGAIGSGIGGAIQSGDLETGLLTGLGAFAGGSLLGPMLGGGADAAAQAASAAAPVAVPAGQISTGSLAAGQTALAPGAAGVTGMSPAQFMPPPTATAIPAPANAGIAGGLKGRIGEAFKFAKSPTGMGVGIGSMAGPMLAGTLGLGDDGGGKKGGGKGRPGDKEPRAIPRIPVMPGAGYRPGTSGEHNYGIGTPYSAGQIMNYTNNGVLPYADGGMLQRMVNPNLPILGPVRLSRGGIVALAEGGDPGEQMQAPNEREVISAAVAAVKGQHPQPEIALGAFLAQYGEEALRQLVDAVEGGKMGETAERFSEGEKGEVRGPGDGSGKDDMVPAKMDDGSGDVLLSDGEFVLRKDATDSLERMFGGGFLDSVNKAGPKAAQVARQRMAMG
jgi:hypothetical protein